MSILDNLSDLAHELRCAAGTVLTILGLKLEAGVRARVDASSVCASCGHVRVDHVNLVGPCGHRTKPSMAPCTCEQFVGSVGAQWLTEFEEQRDSLEPDEQLFECSAPTCGCHDDPRYQAFPAPEDSAVAAADPSPTVPNAHSVVGGEGPGGASDIPQSAPPGQPIDDRCSNFPCSPGCASWGCEYAVEPSPVPPVVAGESPREEDEQPSLGAADESSDDEAVKIWQEMQQSFAEFGIELSSSEFADGLRAFAEAIDPTKPVSQEDLSAHIEAVRNWCNARIRDGKSCGAFADEMASDLLADYSITTK